MTTDQLSALKSRLELAVNETTGEFREDLCAAFRVVAAMEKLDRIVASVGCHDLELYRFSGMTYLRMPHQKVSEPTLIEAIEAVKEPK